MALGLAVAVTPSCSPDTACDSSSCSAGQTCTGGACNPSGNSAVTTFCHDYATAYCNGLVDCTYLDANALNPCIAYYEESECGLSSASVTRGYATFDAAKGTACVQALTQAFETCDYYAAARCLETLSAPQSGEGQACLIDSDCKDAKTYCTGSGCNRTCQHGGGLNQRCTALTNTHCNDGLYCNDAKDTCEALQPVGSKCKEFPPSCVPTAYCEFSQFKRTCVARKSSGAACTASTECVLGLLCNSGVCTPKSGEGGPCMSFSDCERALDCDEVTKTCLSLTYGGEGSSCSDDRLKCSDGLLCVGAKMAPAGGVGVTGTCTIPKVGSPCDGAWQCPFYSYCSAQDGGMRTCVAGTLGMACSNSNSCPSGAYCAETCVPQRAKGDSCTGLDETECQLPWQCVTTDGGSGTCEELGSAGDPCTTGPNAVSCKLLNECVNGTCQPYGLVGQPCSGDGLCMSGACLGNTSPGICGTPLADGQSCNLATGNPVECTGQCDSASLTCMSCQ